VGPSGAFRWWKHWLASSSQKGRIFSIGFIWKGKFCSVLFLQEFILIHEKNIYLQDFSIALQDLQLISDVNPLRIDSIVVRSPESHVGEENSSVNIVSSNKRVGCIVAVKVLDQQQPVRITEVIKLFFSLFFFLGFFFLTLFCFQFCRQKL
jgi:hypothetical protein